MKHHFLTGVAVVAALAFSAPVLAQTANPSGGNSMGTPGPNPGGPGLTPYSTGPNPGGSALSGSRSTPSTPPAAMAPSAMPPSSMSDSSSAMPPSHRHTRAYYHHKKMATYHRGKANQIGGTANQLNQEELQRLQAGNFSNPSAPPPGMMPPGQPGGRMTTHGTVQ